MITGIITSVIVAVCGGALIGAGLQLKEVDAVFLGIILAACGIVSVLMLLSQRR